MFNRWDEEVTPDFEEGKNDYTKRELELMADALLKEDARSEICRVCGNSGRETGKVKPHQQFDEDQTPLTDDSGSPLFINFPEIKCREGHSWYQGEGIAKGIGGEDPILFEEHLQSRRRREIFPTGGVPDPSIVAGLYNRTHPQGRKVNSSEQRKKNGASWYR